MPDYREVDEDFKTTKDKDVTEVEEVVLEDDDSDDDFEDIGDLEVEGLEYTDRIFRPEDEEPLN